MPRRVVKLAAAERIKGSISQVPFCDAFSEKICMGGGGSKFFGTQNNLSENIFLLESYANDVRS
jgi:hypothetical protein